MATPRWEPLLRKWSEETLDRLDDAVLAQVPAEARSSRYLGGSGASDADIAALEQRIGRALPESYRSFLQTTNGMFWPMHGVTQLYAAAEVDRLDRRNKPVLDAWQEGSGSRPPVSDAEYSRYDPDQDPAHFRIEYLASSLEVGSMANEDLLLLNPQVINAEGEWEALFMAFWLPGAQRYPSFLQAIEALHAEFLEDN